MRHKWSKLRKIIVRKWSNHCQVNISDLQWTLCLSSINLTDPTSLAVHRWAVTGTPIEKSIDNLYGLLHFLDYEPFSDLNIWKNLTVSFNQGDIEPLIDQCLKNVMWRTCKINVWQEIGLPPQTEIVHHITMSDTQAFFYSDQHAQCANAFFEKAQKLGKSLSMFKMNPKTLKLVTTTKRLYIQQNLNHFRLLTRL